MTQDSGASRVRGQAGCRTLWEFRTEYPAQLVIPGGIPGEEPFLQRQVGFPAQRTQEYLQAGDPACLWTTPPTFSLNSKAPPLPTRSSSSLALAIIQSIIQFSALLST